MVNSKDNILTKTDKPYIKVVLNENYQDFNEFYTDNKETIYKNIIELFKGLTKTRKKSLKLVINSKIDDTDWGTEFVFGKNEIDVLTDFILPFFEDREEYEICGEIVNLHRSLNKKPKKLH